MEEVWKDIKDYEGIYQVSNQGRVKSLARVDRYYVDGVLYRRPRKERILKQEDHHGYKRVSLMKNSKPKWFFVHRLVAEAFIPNPDNLPQVNHKSEVKSENSVENLEWCTEEYNKNYGTMKERLSNMFINRKDLSKPVYCVELGQTFPSISEAARQTNTHFVSIQKCVNGKQLHAGNLTWRFV